jgi:hypothetical protein
MARGLKGRGSRLDERTVSGDPSRGLSGRGDMGLSVSQGIGLQPKPWAPLSRPVGPEGRRFATRSLRFSIMTSRD